MIITNSSIGMDSVRTYTSVSKDAYMRSRTVSEMSAQDFMEALKGVAIGERKKIGEAVTEESEKPENKDADTLSENSEDSLEYLKGKFKEISASKITKVSKQEEDLKSAIRYMILNVLLMLLFGRNGGESDDLFMKAFSNEGLSENELSKDALRFTEITDTETYEHFEAELEDTSFSATGIVRTADGREIDFDIDLTMSRRFAKYTKETGVYESLGVKLCDPLVINIDSCAAEVSDQKFYFDLDVDGKKDSISMLGKGSGFLALDLNEDGIINDGSELFGTKSGDGFKDLAKYDKDGNGWIDEADEVFDRLKVMCFNEDGSTSLYSIKDKGVGAIYLGSRETEFTVTNQENEINAQVRKTGVFLYESGYAGTIQHVDMAVELGA